MRALLLGHVLSVSLVLWSCELSSSGSTGTGGVDSTSIPGTSTVGSDSAVPKGVAEVCVQTINSYRAKNSLKALVQWTDSAACFARQASLDDQANKGHANFGMCREGAQNTCPNWMADQAAGGVEGAMKRCIESMWNEGPGEDYSKHGHYINMTNTSYTKVGCGFHLQNGSVWINMDFR